MAFTKGITCCACISHSSLAFYTIKFTLECVVTFSLSAAFKGSNDFDYFNIFDYFMNDRIMAVWNAIQWKTFYKKRGAENILMRVRDFPIFLSRWVKLFWIQKIPFGRSNREKSYRFPFNMLFKIEFDNWQLFNFYIRNAFKIYFFTPPAFSTLLN